VLEALGVVAIGCLLGIAGLILLGQYRSVFFQNPRAVMSLEVLLQVLRRGGPGYLAALCLLCALWFIAAGIYLFVAEALFTAHVPQLSGQGHVG
jgi:hypothetical protein